MSQELINKLQSLADEFKKLGADENVLDIMSLIGDVQSGKRDETNITIQADIKLEKFDGDNQDQLPSETKHFTTIL